MLYSHAAAAVPIGAEDKALKGAAGARIGQTTTCAFDTERASGTTLSLAHIGYVPQGSIVCHVVVPRLDGCRAVVQTLPMDTLQNLLLFGLHSRSSASFRAIYLKASSLQK